MKYLAIALMLTLAACASEKVSTSDRMVVVKAANPDKGVESAMALADQECRKKGLAARLLKTVSYYDHNYIFECV